VVGVVTDPVRCRCRENQTRSISEPLDPIPDRRTDHRFPVRPHLVPAVTIELADLAILISLAFIATLIALAFIDFETTYLPDALVLPLLTVAIVVSFLVPDREWWQGLADARLDMQGSTRLPGSAIA